MSTPDRRGMLDRADMALSIRRQCMLLGIARSGVYRPPRPANDNDLALMRRLDELFTAWPFLGSRRMTAMLRGLRLRDFMPPPEACPMSWPVWSLRLILAGLCSSSEHSPID